MVGVRILIPHLFILNVKFKSLDYLTKKKTSIMDLEAYHLKVDYDSVY